MIFSMTARRHPASVSLVAQARRHPIKTRMRGLMRGKGKHNEIEA